jgi:hypothetical protein
MKDKTYHFLQEGVPILGQLDVTSSTHKPEHRKNEMEFKRRN